MIDLNVILDVFQERHPYYHSSASVISKILSKTAYYYGKFNE